MSKKNYFIGVDFGGTSIRAGVVDRKGQEVGRVLGIAQWDGPAAVAAVDKLLAEPAG